MSIVTRGLGGGAGTTGGRKLNYNIDLFAIHKPSASVGIDMIVAPTVPATQRFAAISIELLVGDSPTASYSTSILVMDLDDSAERWNEAFI